MNYRIITNNSLVRERLTVGKPSDKVSGGGHYAASNEVCSRTSLTCGFEVAFVSGESLDVLESVEQALQSGWKLLTVPLPPNVPLIRSGIRTIVLQAAESRYDVAGLHCIAQARERMQTLAKPHRAEQRGDLEVIDWTFAQHALRELRLIM